MSNILKRFFFDQAPGKIDIKKYNNLSDAIGRLNLHSPLGPTTRSSHSTFDDISVRYSIYKMDGFKNPFNNVINITFIETNGYI